MIRIAIIDDHASFRQPLAFMIDREPDMTVVGQAGTVREGLLLLTDIDVAIVDLHLPDGHGHKVISKASGANPPVTVLVLTASDDEALTALAIEAGAAGVVHKSSPIAEIIDNIRLVHRGGSLLSSPEIVTMLRMASQHRESNRAAQASLARLTPREREVLQALAEGLHDKEIALQLNVSPETVRTHMVNILSKLGVESRLQALVYATRHGAVEIS